MMLTLREMELNLQLNLVPIQESEEEMMGKHQN